MHMWTNTWQTWIYVCLVAQRCIVGYPTREIPNAFMAVQEWWLELMPSQLLNIPLPFVFLHYSTIIPPKSINAVPIWLILLIKLLLFMSIFSGKGSRRYAFFPRWLTFGSKTCVKQLGPPSERLIRWIKVVAFFELISGTDFDPLLSFSCFIAVMKLTGPWFTWKDQYFLFPWSCDKVIQLDENRKHEIKHGHGESFVHKCRLLRTTPVLYVQRLCQYTFKNVRASFC